MPTDLIEANTTLTTVPVEQQIEESSGLPTTQIAALDALLSGKSITDAADAAGVSRRTIYTWVRENCRFQAALNRGRREMRQAVSSRVEQIAADAAECVARAVREGNVNAAMQILKSLNFLTPTKIGNDDEVLLQIEQDERQEKRETQIALAGLQSRLLLSGRK
jgi:hypothetical protein